EEPRHVPGSDARLLRVAPALRVGFLDRPEAAVRLQPHAQLLRLRVGLRPQPERLDGVLRLVADCRIPGAVALEDLQPDRTVQNAVPARAEETEVVALL